MSNFPKRPSEYIPASAYIRIKLETHFQKVFFKNFKHFAFFQYMQVIVYHVSHLIHTMIHTACHQYVCKINTLHLMISSVSVISKIYEMKQVVAVKLDKVEIQMTH